MCLFDVRKCVVMWMCLFEVRKCVVMWMCAKRIMNSHKAELLSTLFSVLLLCKRIQGLHSRYLVSYSDKIR